MADTKKEIISLASKLIKFKSTKDNPDEMKKCLDFCADYVSKFSKVRRFEFNGKPALVATYPDTKPEIMLVGHLDVVPADEPQYSPFVKNNHLIGRGAIDMKGGDAIIIKLFKDLAKLKPKIGLMLTCDEEIGGINGVGQLVNEYDCKFAITPEPNSGGSAKQINIITKHKGTLWLKVKALGKSAHASQPWTGENAIDKLIIAYERIKEKFYEVKPNMWEPTINLGLISGGETPNKIPDYAEASIDIRWNETFDKDKFMREISKLGVEIEVLEYSPMLDNDENNKYIQHLKKSAQKFTKCEFVKEYGATDMRFFSEKGIPAVSFGPQGEGYHGKHEYLDLNSIMPTYNSLKEFIISC